jgi:predicted AAA+ superfamily ATPase
MNLIDRPEYLESLKSWQKHDDLVKIITGVRRCGKSKLLELFQSYLKGTGVLDEQIIAINLEDVTQIKLAGLKLNKKTRLLEEYDALLDYLLSKINKNVQSYVFLDEIQLLDNWHMVANTLRLQKNIDVYLTGSNAHMFSSDLHNVFGGRFIEIKMQPLSFKEFATAFKNSATTEIYENYTQISGFPQTLDFADNQDMVKRYLLDSVYGNTVQKDIVQRFGITNPVRLDEIVAFMFDNIGKETSLRNIQKTLKSKGIDISPTILNNYVKGMLDSYLMYKCERFDIKGKRILESDAKYYASDIALRAAVIGRSDADVGRSLENIVYLELLRRGYRVSVGKVTTKAVKVDGKTENKAIEVDFVAQKPGGIVEYYQVAWTVLSDDSETLRRELASLEAIRDHNPKYLITMDPGNGMNNGIRRINALNWLLETEKQG